MSEADKNAVFLAGGAKRPRACVVSGARQYAGSASHLPLPDGGAFCMRGMWRIEKLVHELLNIAACGGTNMPAPCGALSVALSASATMASMTKRNRRRARPGMALENRRLESNVCAVASSLAAWRNRRLTYLVINSIAHGLHRVEKHGSFMLVTVDDKHSSSCRSARPMRDIVPADGILWHAKWHIIVAAK